jgi:hypothetical protein
MSTVTEEKPQAPATTPRKPRRWTSPLGLSVLFFLSSGVVHLLIGVAAALISDLELGRQVLVVSTRTDTDLFGTAPSALLDAQPHLALFRSLVFTNAGGSLILLGIFIWSVTWFGLRRGDRWAYWTLVGTGVLILPFWYLTFRPYLAAGIAFEFSDLPPIFWIPALVLIPATVLGWIGLRSSDHERGLA